MSAWARRLNSRPREKFTPPRGRSDLTTAKSQFAAMKRLGITTRRAAFKAAQPKHRHEGFAGKPMFPGLRSIRRQQRDDLGLRVARVDGNIDVGSSEPAIPFWNLVFEDQVIAKGAPDHFIDDAM